VSGSSTQTQTGTTNQKTDQLVNQQGTQTQDTGPWGPQAGALTTAFNDATNTAYNTAKQAVAPDNYVAQMTPDQLATFQKMMAYTNGNTIPDTTGSTATTLQGAGTNAVTGALSGLNSFDPTQLNSTNPIVDAANKYVAGQDIDAQVRDAMLNATQTARDVTLPGIERDAALTGNTNSSRTGPGGIAEGLVQRGLAEQAGNLGATLRNAAFSHGLDLASANANANNSAILAALQARLGGGNTAAAEGVNAGSSSINDKGQLFSLADKAGSGEQAAQQAYLDNLYKQYLSKVQAPYDPINGLMSVIGSQKWGQTGTATTSNSGTTSGTATGTSDQKTTSTPSAWQIIGGLLGGLGSGANTAGSLGWKPFG